LAAGEYRVERILQVRQRRNRRSEALVQWVGWEDPTWEPKEHVESTRAWEIFSAGGRG
jgi:hypothetical protein